MSELHIRLQKERVRLGLSQDEFGELGGVKRRAQINYESGERCPDGHYYERIGKAGADVQYILTGERGTASATKTASISLNKEEVEVMKAAINEKTTAYAKSEFAEIPRYNVRAAAGHGALNGQEEQSQPLAFRRDWLAARHLSPANLKIIDVHGDSMEPYLKDKDLVLVDLSQTDINGGNTYVLRIDDSLLVKKLQRVSHDVVQIASFNPVYPAYQVDLSDESLGMTIIGRVVASMHEW